jgi:G3E family GTPase
MRNETLPVVLLSGFLGSGKALLLNRLLPAPDFANTAVIVNEFGEIGLDHVLVEPGTDNVVLLEAGCGRRRLGEAPILGKPP